MPEFLLLASALACAAGGSFVLSRLRAWARRRRERGRQGGTRGQPLSKVIAECEARWFLADLKLAMEGQQDAMVRVSHMLLAGYGVRQDPQAAAQWIRKAWAIQNYREPSAVLAEALDPDDSAIPAFNAREGARAAARQAAAQRAAAAADAAQPGSRGGSGREADEQAGSRADSPGSSSGSTPAAGGRAQLGVSCSGPCPAAAGGQASMRVASVSISVSPAAADSGQAWGARGAGD